MPESKSLQELFEQHERLQATLPKPPDIVYDPAKFGSPQQLRFSSASLDPYTGEWTRVQAAHLLRRTIVGPTQEDIDRAVQDGLDGTMLRLFNMGETPDPPLNPFFNFDPLVAIDQPWPYKGLSPLITNQIRAYRNESLSAWTMGLLLNHHGSIREKMVLFWHNHFPVADLSDPSMTYQYSVLLRNNALGNFKQLVKDVSILPAMLEYLNGDENKVQAPNENYARELLELFTIGKRELAGPGDYTTFTEEDVSAIAKVMTGWVVQGRFSSVNIDEGDLKGVFRPGRHDTSTKTLSHRFNNAIIENRGEAEYEQLIDLIFEQEEVSKYICRELYRWFVYYLINDDVEEAIIKPMAQELRNNNYNIGPVVELLLNSQHFFESNLHGAMIKNPIDFALGMINQYKLYTPDSIQTQYEWWGSRAAYFLSGIIQMQYYNPPDVAGWKAYYQEPVFYQIWINSVTLTFRRLITDVFSVVGTYIDQVQDDPATPQDESDPPRGSVIPDFIFIDGIAIMESMSNPSEVDVLLTDLGNLLHPKPLTDIQKFQLKQILIPGLPDFEWTTEYGIWAADRTNPTTTTTIRNKMAFLLRTLMIMPEYYLS